VAAEEKLTEFIGYEDKVKLAAGNLFKAHKQAIGELLTRGNADRQRKVWEISPKALSCELRVWPGTRPRRWGEVSQSTLPRTLL
jgi:hypothetical protein